MPYFVMYVLKHAKGLAGVYIAVLFSGSLRYPYRLTMVGIYSNATQYSCYGSLSGEHQDKKLGLWFKNLSTCWSIQETERRFILYTHYAGSSYHHDCDCHSHLFFCHWDNHMGLIWYAYHLLKWLYDLFISHCSPLLSHRCKVYLVKSS